jgi:hypothetical protein
MILRNLAILVISLSVIAVGCDLAAPGLADGFDPSHTTTPSADGGKTNGDSQHDDSGEHDDGVKHADSGEPPDDGEPDDDGDGGGPMDASDHRVDGGDGGAPGSECNDHEPNDTTPYKIQTAAATFCGFVSATDTDRFTFDVANQYSIQVRAVAPSAIHIDFSGPGVTNSGSTLNAKVAGASGTATLRITSKGATPQKYELVLKR